MRTAAETRLPRVFAFLSRLADHRAARNPASELQFVPLLVRPGELACDIGANRGVFTYWLLRLGADVATFEPNPFMGRILRRRFPEALEDGRLRLFDGALSDESGLVELHIPRGYSPLATIDGNAVGQGVPVDEVTVRCFRLDDCLDENISFIKIDVEGHEQKVIDGGLGLIASFRPTLLIEAEERHRPGAVASLRASLEPLGYEGYFARADGLHPIATFDAARDQSPASLNEAGTAARAPFAYINNFLFVGRSDVKARLVGWRPTVVLPTN
ncbi:FkbM family methyltransferase [Ancylobacter radicis]|uniref:FkbM family methyltransferase n=1 Tax=Ancylobacter radicis TaxID=2836179 RepID=UPI002022F22B|nr:FkbM family methyltransferase [Ancylobacter radicis]